MGLGVDQVVSDLLILLRGPGQFPDILRSPDLVHLPSDLLRPESPPLRPTICLMDLMGLADRLHRWGRFPLEKSRDRLEAVGRDLEVVLKIVVLAADLRKLSGPDVVEESWLLPPLEIFPFENHLVIDHEFLRELLIVGELFKQIGHGQQAHDRSGHD